MKLHFYWKSSPFPSSSSLFAWCTHSISISPSKNVTISFIRNTARLSGAAIFASDMQQCGWLGENTTDNSLIFNPPAGLPSPFTYKWVTCIVHIELRWHNVQVDSVKLSFSSFSVGCCINREKGYLLPIWVRKITCQCFNWMLQSSSGQVSW